MACDAIATNGKRFVIGQSLGSLKGGLHLSDIGNTVLARICDYARMDTSQVWLLEMTDTSRIEARLRQAFDIANEGTPIMVICRTPAIIDALLPFLVLQKPGSA